MPDVTIEHAIGAIEEARAGGTPAADAPGMVEVPHARALSALAALGADDATARRLVAEAAERLGGRVETTRSEVHNVHAGRSFATFQSRTTILLPAPGSPPG
jgi:hypothetical protein